MRLRLCAGTWWAHITATAAGTMWGTGGSAVSAGRSSSGTEREVSLSRERRDVSLSRET